MHAKSKTDFRLTKTDYLKYLACPQEFWLEYHQPLLFAEPITLEHEHRRQEGYEVENLVRKMARFQPNDEFAVDFQRTFQTDKLLTRSDVIVTNKASGEIDIFEIKASGSIKPEHYDDVAFQKIAATKAGLQVRGCYLITINGDYVLRGEVDVEQLFTVTDISEKVETRLADTEDEIKKAFEYLLTQPVPSLVDYCNGNKLNCRFIKLHFSDLPEYSVFDISYLKHDKRRKLLSDGIIDILDVPDDFPLSDKQRRQVQTAKTGEIYIDRESIASQICEWKYPFHFLDYETFAYAIPQFDGVKAFQQMCFQYSLHTIDSPDGEMRHSEYLSCDDDDPARAVAKHLRTAMSGGIGTVFVWHEDFEKTRNKEMAEMFPELADFFNEVNEKTCDLEKIFTGELYIHPQFKGKTSIKKVLPVLVPSLSYDELGIGDGLSATIKWFRARTRRSMSDAERATIFNDLQEYCELDTVAMVEIYNALAAL